MRGYAAIVGVFWQKCGFLPDPFPLGLSPSFSARGWSPLRQARRKHLTGRYSTDWPAPVPAALLRAMRPVGEASCDDPAVSDPAPSSALGSEPSLVVTFKLVPDQLIEALDR
jgi:hypothetical protein